VKNRFGERTSDVELLAWSGEHDTVLMTNDASGSTVGFECPVARVVR
jgi:hypothetical protein